MLIDVALPLWNEQEKNSKLTTVWSSFARKINTFKHHWIKYLRGFFFFCALLVFATRCLSYCVSNKGLHPSKYAFEGCLRHNAAASTIAIQRNWKDTICQFEVCNASTL